MPELPEVETVVRELRIHLPGKHILRASLTAPDLYRRGSANVAGLAGTQIRSIDRRGKAIVISLQPAGADADAVDRLVVHLGMTGRLEWAAAPQGRAGGEPARERVAPYGAPGAERSESGPGWTVPGPAKRAQSNHLHARWEFADGSELRYFDPRRFGFIFVGTAASVDDTLCIGPDPFQLDARTLEGLLKRRRAPVKSLLLDQHLVSGLGNIYVDEALHLARVHPLTSGDRASRRAADILAAARLILKRAIRARGTTLRDYRRTDGSTGEFQLKLSVYGRDGDKCRVCTTVIRRIVVSQRGTHFCPRCQRRPRLSSASAKTSSVGRSRRAGPRRAGYTRSR